MSFWPCVLCDILIPVVMLITGRFMWKHCPKHINGLMGYRTTRSMKNMDTWKFAHDTCGRFWWKTGWIMLVFSALTHVPFYNGDEKTLGTVSLVLIIAQLVVLIASIIPTELALKKTFHSDGTRR